MLINVHVVVPAKLNAEQKELFRQLARTFGDGPPEHPKGFFDRIFGA
jgi:DnaJ-class molecular chaperone